MIRAKVKQTGRYVYLRRPYNDEYISAIYEPDFVEVDEYYDTIKNDEIGSYSEYNEDELEDIDYCYNEKTQHSDDPYRNAIDKIRDVLDKHPVNLDLGMEEFDATICCEIVGQIQKIIRNI